MKTRENPAGLKSLFTRVWISKSKTKNPKLSSLLPLYLLLSRLVEVKKKGPKKMSNDLD